MSWIDRYCESVAETEPPIAFNLWAAIAALGHVVGRKASLHLAQQPPIYPGQMMVLLCAEHALSRKAAAIRNVRTFLDTLPPEYVHCVTPTSPAGLLDALRRTDRQGNTLDATGLVVCHDFAATFGRKDTHGEFATLLSALNAAPEGLWRSPGARFGRRELLNPCVGLLGAVTRSGLGEDVALMRRTGVLGQCIIVDSDGASEPHSGLKTSPGAAALREWLLQDLHKRILGIKGPFTFDPAAADWYEAWYRKHFYAARTATAARGSGWPEHKHVHVLRTAMILACAERSDRVLRVSVLKRAVKEIGRIEARFGSIVQDVGESPVDVQRKHHLVEKVTELSRKRGGWVMKRVVFHYVHRWYGKRRQGQWALFEADLREAEEAGDLIRRYNAKGQREEWRVARESSKGGA